MEGFSEFASSIFRQKYAISPTETWEQCAERVVRTVCGAVGEGSHYGSRFSESEIQELIVLISERKFLPGGRYLYAAGRPFHQVQNCLLLRAEDSREGWSELLRKASMALMTGAGIGVDYSEVRAEGSLISRTGGKATGPLALMQMVNECGRHIMQGGARRSAIWAGLRWSHPDIFQFIRLKNWNDDVRKMKEKDFNAAAPLDGTNISVILDKDFFTAHGDINHPLHDQARKVYADTVRSMVSTAEPGFSVDYLNKNESLRNACTEVCSEDDSDICNLGSLNLARFRDIREFQRGVILGTKFLMAGTIYSDLPYEKVGEIREKNRRLGLGLMGFHEWLLQRGKPYGPDESLGEWLTSYRYWSDNMAAACAAEWGISRPVKTRAIAPNGTIGIIAETSTGIEPIFCVAYRRRYRGADGKTTQYQYVIDPTAKRLIDSGVRPEDIEDAYRLARTPEVRIEFQTWVQEWVDHGISSTLNLPAWGSEYNNEATLQSFSDMLFDYLPVLRGITAYPDGGRSGQPLVPVEYSTAVGKTGQVFLEQADLCDITGKGGSCGS